MRHTVVLLTLCLLVAWSPFVLAGFGGDVAITGTVHKADEWGLSMVNQLGLDYRSRSSQARFDARLEAIWPGDEGDLEATLERLSIRFTGWRGDVSVGRQPLRWGVGQTWGVTKSPLNIYADNFWGVSARLPTAPLAFWTFTAGRVNDRMLYSVRQQDYVRGLRWSAMVAGDGERLMVGLDGKVDVGWEIYADWLYHVQPTPYFQAIVGADYQLGPFVAVTEYRYDGDEAPGGGQFVSQVVTATIDHFSSWAVGVDFSVTDHSRLWHVGYETLLVSGLDMHLGASFARGEAGSHYGAVRQAAGGQRYVLQLRYVF